MDNSRSFGKAITFNNAGAKHLERGDVKSALKALTIAFHSFKKTYHHNKRCRVHLSQRERQGAVSNPPNMDEWMKTMPYSEDNTVVLIYQHPIRIPENLESNTAWIDSSSGLVSTAITFNLALTNHLRGLETKNNEALKVAARLYEHCFSLERIRGCSLFVSPLFLVSILNNLGSAHRLVEDIDRSEKCFRQLLSTLLYLTQNRGINPAEMEVFFGNISLGLPGSFLHCAGAA